MKCGVIIAAAGRGARLGVNLPKALVALGERPLYQHSLAVFQTHPAVEEIVLVVPIGCKVSETKKIKVVPGGERRQDSVACGLQALSPKQDHVLIHDAARPFVSPLLIDRLLAALKEKGNAIVTEPVSDTIKQVEGDRLVKTVARQYLRGAQTPQGFQVSVLKSALQEARRKNWEVTDEAMLLEKMGIPVYWVEGDPLNIKITTEADLKLAEIIDANRTRL